MSKKESNPQPPSESVKPQPPPPPPPPPPKRVIKEGVKFIDQAVVRKQDYQDVLVKECKYCPLCDDSICAAIRKMISGEPRDKDNFPKFCPLADRPILIRR